MECDIEIQSRKQVINSGDNETQMEAVTLGIERRKQLEFPMSRGMVLYSSFLQATD